MYHNAKQKQYVETSDNDAALQLDTPSFKGHLGYFTGKEFSFLFEKH